MARPGEDDLIARFFVPLAGPGALALRDDAAIVEPPLGRDLVVTVDGLVAGIHFRADDPPDAIGWKALAVNLSDLAAKGADPLGFLLTLALPDDWTEDWLGGFADGLGRLAAESGCALLGGDTVRAGGPLTLSVTALGSLPRGSGVRRTNVRPGDVLAVTGTIGDAVLGLALGEAEPPSFSAALPAGDAAALLDRYRRPQPRSAFALPLRSLAGAAMDVSDGLVGDLAKMLRVSGLGGTLDLDRVPFSEAGRRAVGADPAWRDRMVTGGDDYEILLACRPDRFARLADEADAVGLPLAAIGEAGEPGGPFVVRDGRGVVDLTRRSFSHFSGSP